MPFSASPFLASSTFPFSFLFGRNPILPFLKVVCYHSSSLSWFPEAFSVYAMRGRSRFTFISCFLFLSSFYRSVLVFLFLCTWRDPCLLMVPEDPCFLYFAVVLFFWMLLFSGLQDPLGLSFIPSWVSRIYYFGPSLNFPFRLDLFFFGLISLWPFFRPQQSPILLDALKVKTHLPTYSFTWRMKEKMNNHI